ncbi:SARP family transcriptional regulator [Streptomyces spiroverticillatus]|uniref:SARP family transcriptional regulator n=1 Tax=Streptomyces finlayi TaxID=67296 RepID=A0A918X6Y6_9ACTN|nr:BTAD domain-containing putative transcriptional regulator [Streptomyces finlayi]GHA29954.1 SARP family transcriptional regulator [Streptomyces spiroverticillatus]GHD15183.1 SARP family transcriptional regulator [Streptomyces finlayi]
MAAFFGVLGTLEVWRNGDTVDVGHAMQRRVLAALLVDAGRAVSVDALVDRVWGESDPTNGRKKLYGYISRLRHTLESDGVFLTRQPGGGYRLGAASSTIDAHRFQDLCRLARVAGDDARAEELWRDALGLWRGSAFAGADTPWFNSQRALLEGERLAAQLDLADVQLRMGQHDRMLSELAARAEAQPLDERVIGQFVLALYRCGRQAEALEVYERARRRLRDELGVDPGVPLRDLHARILGGGTRGAGARTARSSPASPRGDVPVAAAGSESSQAVGRQLAPRLLPADLSLFVGRGQELDHACRMLVEEGPGPATLLVTGPAGVGKTAFAIRAGHRLSARFPDGQLHADLRGFGGEPADPFTVLGAFLRALDTRGGTVPAELTGRIHLYRTLLAQRQILVVLDNAADAEQVADLLPSGPRCATILTSRTAMTGLNVPRLQLGELTPTAGLALLREMLGPERIDAEPDSARSIVRTCGGLPLAVWVAGARLAARPNWPLAKVARLLNNEQRKLDVLAVGHIAVRASLELSYRGMANRTRTALELVALLPGPQFAAWALAPLLDVDLTEAEAVLDDLVEVHLVQTLAPTRSSSTGGTRCQLHDLVRLFGRERVEESVPPGERAAALTRLVEASLHLADRAADTLSVDFQGIPPTGTVSWRFSPADTDVLLADPLAWFTDERQFLIDVAEQALDRADTVPAAGLAIALTTLFQVGSHFDDWERLQNRALKAALSADDGHTAAKIHRCLGELTTVLDRYPEALHHFEQALLLTEGQEPGCRASATAGLAYVHRLLGRYPSATAHFEEAARLAASAGNVNCLVYATNGLGVVELELGRTTAAVSRFTECLQVSRDAGYRPGEAQALRCLGQSHRARGDHAAAADAYRQAAAISEMLGDRLTTTHATCWLGDVLTRQGKHHEGRRLLARSLWAYREFGNLWGEAATLYALAEAQLAVGRAAPARRRAEAAVALWRRTGSRTWLAIGLRTLAAAHELAGDGLATALALDEADSLQGST